MGGRGGGQDGTAERTRRSDAACRTGDRHGRREGESQALAAAGDGRGRGAGRGGAKACDSRRGAGGAVAREGRGEPRAIAGAAWSWMRDIWDPMRLIF